MKRLKKKSLLLVAGIVLMLTIAIGGTIAYIVTNTDPVVNTFTPGAVPIRIEENFDGTTKQAVKIENIGNVPAYIRAKIVVTWKDAAGNVSGAGVPVSGTDYSMTIGSSWQEGSDDFYYYKYKVNPNTQTTELIGSCTKATNANPPEGYNLSVEIIAESIQAEGMGAANAQDAFAKAKQ